MTRTMRWACCVLMLGGFAAACTDEQEAAKPAGEVSTVVTEDQRRQAGLVYFEDLASDGSIHCPTSEICPQEERMAADGGPPPPDWTGVLIPRKAVNENSVVCVQGHNDDGSPCPPGWNGRLWRTHPADVGLDPVARDVQPVCLPGNKQDICAQRPNDNDQDYGFFCRQPNFNCRGIAGKTPYTEAAKPEKPKR